MPETSGIHHLGLSVHDLEQTTAFFVRGLGWEEVGKDLEYPRTAVSDGICRLTLWQVDRQGPMTPFDRRANVGLHHLALGISSEEKLQHVAVKVAAWPGVKIEFMPELLSGGPRKHMMFVEPGGLRIELIWPVT
ncbi:VOC family protein [Roseibium algae]|uniref:VOC family protein n=1 Tax=Roseibium algae TaxID=3123038 RepID=A0ABU8TME9_9HYPH